MAIFRLLNETQNDSAVVSVQHATDRLENGNLVGALSLVTGEKELYVATKVADITKEVPVAICAPDMHETDDGMRLPITDPRKISFRAKKALRAYRLKKDFQFVIQSSLITGTATEGQWLVATNASYGFTALATAPTTQKMALLVERTGIFESVGNELVPVVIARVVIEG